ncbi:DUF6531 domain-containing protein [Micromonospora chersina]|uniref:DUF6531 domain-containing protein n=1 Tax=Micromonospora chersina TaxID=47854 RepID=UPI0037236097
MSEAATSTNGDPADAGWTYELAPDAGTVTFDGTTYQPGDTYHTTSACEMKAFLGAYLDQTGKPFQEAEAGAFDRLIQQCPDGDAPSSSTHDVDTPVPADPALDADGPDHTETADDLGAVTPDTGGVLRDEPPAPGDPEGRVAAEQLYDRRAPQDADEVAQRLLDAGVPDADVGPLIDAGQRGDPPPGQPHPFRSGEVPDDAAAADPVNLFTGEYVLNEVDLEIPGDGPALRLVRVYSSGWPAFGPFGFNWDHSYNVYLRELDDGSVAVWTGRLREQVHQPRPDGGFEPPPGVFTRLEPVPAPLGASGYLLTMPGGQTWWFRRPTGWPQPETIPLVGIADATGAALDIRYDSRGRPATVRDAAGRGFTFGYGECGLLEHVTDTTGRTVRYLHDSDAEHLAAVIGPSTEDNPDGLTWSYEYDDAAAHPALRHNIVATFDPVGELVVENEYGADPGTDDFNRVIRQIYLGEEHTYRATRLRYVDPGPESVNDAALRVAYRPPGEGERAYTFSARGHLLEERMRLAADGSYRIWATAYRYSSLGQLITVRKPSGLALVYEYDEQADDPCDRGNLLRVVAVAGPQHGSAERELATFSYGPLQTVRTVTDEAGATTRYVYDHDLDPLGGGAKLLIETHHPQATVPDGTTQDAVERYAYTAGRLREHIDAEGNRTRYEYHDTGPATGLVAAIAVNTGSEEYRVSVEYDRYGNVRKVLSASGASHEIDTDALGRIRRLRRPAINGNHAEVVNRYGPSGLLVEQRTPRGALVDPALVDGYLRHDLATTARTRTMVLAANTSAPRQWLFETDWAGRVTGIIDPLGRKTRQRYDERGLLIERTTPAGNGPARTERFGYDRNGNLVRHVQPSGGVIRYQYDGFDRLIDESRPAADGSRTHLRYRYGPRDQLELAQVVGASRPAGPPSVLAAVAQRFDERGRVVGRDEGGQGVALWYDRNSQLVRLVDQRGAATQIRADALGRVRHLADAAGNTVDYNYDADGNLGRVTERDVLPSGAVESYTTQLSYDARNRLCLQVDPLGNTIRIEYDERDLPVAVVSPSGIRHEYHHDGLGALTRAAVAGREHQFVRDRAGRVTVYRDPTGAQTRYGYTTDDSWQTITGPDGTPRRRRFGPAGDLIEESSPTGAVRFVPGDDGLPKRLAFSAGGGSLGLADVRYDRDGLGRAVRVAHDTGILDLSYDEAGRVAQETLNGVSVRWQRNDQSGLARLRYPDGRVDRYEYDLLGRLARVVLEHTGPATPPALTAGSVLVEYDYAGNGRLWRRRLGNGSQTTYRYDGGRRLVAVEHRGPSGALLAATEYVYDADSHRRFIRTTPSPGTASLLDVDVHGRLRRVTDGISAPALPAVLTQADADAFLTALGQPNGSRQYTYTLDDADFRLATVVRDSSGQTTFTATPGPRHEITALSTSGAPPTAFGHDGDGRRTTDGRYRYSYDVLGRLREVREVGSGALRARLTYDPLGRLQSVEQAGATTALRYFGQAPLQEEAGGGTVLAQRTPGMNDDELVLRATATGGLWAHQDGRLSLLAISDDTGLVAERYGYGPFGECGIFAPDGVTHRSASDVGVAPVFGTHVALAPAGLYHARGRAYDATTGVFLQRDRRGYTDSANPYCYLGHGPADTIDPSGEVLPIIAAFVIMGALAGAGYSFYDANEHPERYSGSHFSFRTLGNTVAGSLIGAVSGMAAHAVATLAVGGTTAFGTGTAGAGALGAGGLSSGSLTLVQRFVIGGTMSVASGYLWRTGFHGLFPEYEEPPSVGNMTFDYVTGGLLGPSSREGLQAMLRDTIPASFAPRAISNNWRLMTKGRWLSRLTGGWLGGRYKYSPLNMIWEDRIGREGFKRVSQQYWRGQADGSALHHLWVSQRANVPRWFEGFRNAGWNLLETGGAFNSWMGRGALRDVKEWAFRGAAAGVLALTGYGSYAATSQVMADASSGADSSNSHGTASPASLGGIGGDSDGGIPGTSAGMDTLSSGTNGK